MQIGVRINNRLVIHIYTKHTSTDTNYLPYTALKMVVKGKIDCALFERLAFKYVLKQLETQGDYSKKFDKKPVIATVISKETVHVGYTAYLDECKSDAVCALASAVDIELTKLKQSGKLQQIIAQLDIIQ
jgi:ABC-type amino acid transport substrate-binding protein